jgi:cAMP-dependent protein kinase regulator
MSGQFSSPFGANANPFGTPSAAPTNTIVEEEENDTVGTPQEARFGTGSHPGFSGPFGGGDASTDTPPTMRGPPDPSSYPAQYNFNRRTSVSAESLKPSGDVSDNWSPPFAAKSPEQLQRLKKAIEGNFLFSHLEDEQSQNILGALVEKPIPAKGIKVRFCRLLPASPLTLY